MATDVAAIRAELTKALAKAGWDSTNPYHTAVRELLERYLEQINQLVEWQNDARPYIFDALDGAAGESARELVRLLEASEP
jgi:phosphomannomutase